MTIKKEQFPVHGHDHAACIEDALRQAEDALQGARRQAHVAQAPGAGDHLGEPRASGRV